MNKALLRIGFADDDMDDHLLFVRAIRSYYSVPCIDCFFDTDEMLASYTRTGAILPHILFLDKNMPGNYDYECLVKIKDHQLLRSIPVIIYSTSCVATEITEALRQGAAAFISKPVGFNQTVDVLRSAIEQFVPHRFQNQDKVA